MVKSSSKSDKKGSSKNKSKLDPNKADDIKEKSYITKEVDTSIAILDSPESDVVLESLMFLSKYADIQLNNLNYLQQHGLLKKLLTLFDRNICILRLSLRLIGVLLTIDDIISEFDQEAYDDKIIEISNMYISHKDAYVKEFCVSILAKLATSCRVTCLIFKIDLFNPILITIKITDNVSLLTATLELLYVLLNAPAALSILPDLQNFNMSIVMMHLEHPEVKVRYLIYKIIRKLTYFSLEVYQKMFRLAKLVQIMFAVVMDPKKVDFHQEALHIITNCMRSDETSSYFIESLEFVQFCQWVKTCDQDYILACVNLFEELSRMPKIRQVLFDLSVEDSILYFLRSTEKNVLNKTCEAISNMSTHKYCCERMLTPIVLKELLHILLRKDKEDPENEVALKTLFDFSRRNVNTMDMLFSIEAHDVILFYFFTKGSEALSEESFLRVLEMLYKWVVHPSYQGSIISDNFFQELLNLFQGPSNIISTFACEIMTNFVHCGEFRNAFLLMSGPQIFIGALKTTRDPQFLKNILIFIHSNLVNEKITRALLENNLVRTLIELPEEVKTKAPIIKKILELIYNLHLPLKLFKINKLDITDKLDNRFYVINGPWKTHFPFLEILEALQLCTIYTIYVVDYSYIVKKVSEEDSLYSLSLTSTGISSKSSSVNTLSNISSKMSECLELSPFEINYGRLSPDPYLPRYIYHINKYISTEETVEKKIKILAEYVDSLLCGPKEEYAMAQKIHTFKLHIESLKEKLGTNMIPIGFLRIGFHCERALLFKALADKTCIPSSLIKAKNNIYWNEVALFDCNRNDDTLKLFVVDLMNNVGTLLMVGSRAANQYCNLKA